MVGGGKSAGVGDGSPAARRHSLAWVRYGVEFFTCCYSGLPVFVRVLALVPFSFPLRAALHSSYLGFRVCLSGLHNNALDLRETPSRLGSHNNALGFA